MSGHVSRQEFREDISRLHEKLDNMKDDMNAEREQQFRLLSDKLGPIALLTETLLELKKNNLKTKENMKPDSGTSKRGKGASLAGPWSFLRHYRS